VIFIITTPQLMNSLDMNLPTPNKNKSNVKPKFTRIVIDDRGGVTLNGEFVTISELKDKLGAMKAENADLPVVVKGSDQVEYQKMVSVLNVLQDLSITKVGLATD
jgi:biopolymer transport protein ExbD